MKPHQLNAPAAARRVGALTSLAVLALVAGCASSAGIQSEARAIEPQSVGLSSAATPAQAVPADWWRSWGDATLSAVIDQALQSQPSLKVAEARLRRAQAGTAGEEAADGLRINGSADVTRQRFSATSIYPAPLGGSTRTLANAQLVKEVADRRQTEATLRVGDEIHLSAGQSIKGQPFDQNRAMAFLQYFITNNLSVDVGYINWYQQRSANQGFYNRHIIDSGISLSFDLSKKKNT